MKLKDIPSFCVFEGTDAVRTQVPSGGNPAIVTRLFPSSLVACLMQVRLHVHVTCKSRKEPIHLIHLAFLATESA
jgi:hypothetical protein